MESNSNGCGNIAPSSINVLTSCICYMSAVFTISLMIKLSLRMYQERLTFVDHTDDVQYHLIYFYMEIVEITEQYCYTMIIGISMKNDFNIVYNCWTTICSSITNIKQTPSCLIDLVEIYIYITILWEYFFSRFTKTLVSFVTDFFFFF